MTAIRLFSHQGETHDSTVESASHFLGLEPVSLVVLGLLAAILIVAAVQLLLHRPAATMILALGLLFFIGVFSYSVAPLVAATCIVIGFALSLALAFIGIVKG